MYYSDQEIPREMRLLVFTERVQCLNDYCRRGLQNVDLACDMWKNLQTETDAEERLRLLGEGEAFLHDAIAIAREYSRQMPDPNKLKTWLGKGKRADGLIKLVNGIAMVILNFTQQMEDMTVQCKALRRHLESRKAQQPTQLAA